MVSISVTSFVNLTSDKKMQPFEIKPRNTAARQFSHCCYVELVQPAGWVWLQI